MQVNLAGYSKEAETLSFAVEQEGLDPETVVVDAAKLRELMLTVMGGKDDKGAYRKDLRTARGEVEGGVHNDVFADAVERAIFHLYIDEIFNYYRAKTFNIGGGAVNVAALKAAWDSDNVDIIESEDTMQWWDAFVMWQLV